MKKIIASLLFVPLTATANFETGNSLLSKINSSSYGDKFLALGYIMGVFDGSHNIFHCAPDGITAGQLNDLTKQVLEASPVSRNVAADALLVYVFKQAWPCKKGSGV